MGEVVDMILEGILCQYCGAYIGRESEGIPQSCDNCSEDYPEDDN